MQKLERIIEYKKKLVGWLSAFCAGILYHLITWLLHLCRTAMAMKWVMALTMTLGSTHTPFNMLHQVVAFFSIWDALLGGRSW